MKEIITTITYAIGELASIGSMLIFSHYVLKKQLSFKVSKTVVLFVLTIANAAIGSFVLMKLTEDYKAVMDFVSNVTEIAALMLLTRDRKLWKAIMLVFIFSFSVDMLYSLFTDYISKDLYIEALIDTAFYAFIAGVIILAAKRSSVNILPQVFDEIPFWLYIVLLFFELTCYYRRFGVSASWYNIMYIISSVGILLTVLYLVYRIFSLSYRQNLILNQIESQKEYGERMIVGDEELRRFHHDYRNHLIVVNAYLQSGRIDDAREYLNTINSSVDSALNKIVTGNFVADAIINNKAIMAKEADVKYSFDGIVPREGIRNEDLCTVLANLLDNALEACAMLPPGSEKVISVKAQVYYDFFNLHIRNSTVLDSLSIRTAKRDKRNHGLGLKNVDRVIKEYNGAVTRAVENRTFITDVRLCMKKG